MAPKIKILYLVNYFPPSTGAAALNSLEIVKYLVKFGHKVYILAPGDMGKTLFLESTKTLDNFENITLSTSNHLLKAPVSWIFSHFENMAKFLLKLKKKFSPDLILSQYHAFHYASVCAGYLSKKLNIPHFVRSHDIFIDLSTHSIPYRIYFSMNYPRIYRSILNCDIFYVTASEMIRYFLKFKKLRNVNFKIHHNGIDADLFHPYKNQDALRDKYGCETLISFIGLMTQDIGIHNFISIFPKILEANKDTHLLLIGDGPYKKQILNLMNKLNLNRNIHFLGIKPHFQIPFYMNNSTIGIGRITHKKMWRYMVPVKCLEYMACKKPFISTPISIDVIKNNDVGILLKRDFDSRELVDKLTMLIEDKSLRAKLGENGYKKINQSFTWEAIMKNFNTDLKEIKKENH